VRSFIVGSGGEMKEEDFIEEQEQKYDWKFARRVIGR
jgi:hypothetical protein